MQDAFLLGPGEHAGARVPWVYHIRCAKKSDHANRSYSIQSKKYELPYFLYMTTLVLIMLFKQLFHMIAIFFSYMWSNVNVTHQCICQCIAVTNCSRSWILKWALFLNIWKKSSSQSNMIAYILIKFLSRHIYTENISRSVFFCSLGMFLFCISCLGCHMKKMEDVIAWHFQPFSIALFWIACRNKGVIPWFSPACP